MAKRKTPPRDTTGECPAWFMTYSDVVTLLMTFFILLLTFSTNEPERFEKMKVTMFGGGGATGVAAARPPGLDQDSFVLRIRPRAARLAMQGAEMPPLEKEASKQTVDGALAGLEESKTREVVDAFSFVVKLCDFVSEKTEVTTFGRQHLKMLAKQIRNLPYEVILETKSANNIDGIVAMTEHLFKECGVPSGKFSVMVNELSAIGPGELTIVVRKHRRATDDAQKKT